MIRFYLQKLVRDKVVKKCLDDEEVLHTEYCILDKQEHGVRHRPAARPNLLVAE